MKTKPRVSYAGYGVGVGWLVSIVPACYTKTRGPLAAFSVAIQLAPVPIFVPAVRRERSLIRRRRIAESGVAWALLQFDRTDVGDAFGRRTFT